MSEQLVDPAAPPKLPSDVVPLIPHGADPESEIAGPVAGRYDLGERIARGGMGIVYRAHDRLLNRTVAVKVMRGKYLHRADLLRRFTTEARINGRLQHPGVVPVYEVGTLGDGRPFIAMKLIEGQTLSRLLRERSDPAENQAHFLKVFEALCQTVAYAHKQGVIHRDLKPDNVMVGAFGEVQVMDWGLAKFLDPADAVAPSPDGFEAIERSVYLSTGDGMASTPAEEHQTHATEVVAVGPETAGIAYTTAGEVLGTLAYMPPEQARGEMDRVDRRSDVFSLGAILCQILTGQPPYYGPPENLKEMAREGKLFGANILLDRCGADGALVSLAKICLAIELESRPANAGVLAELVTDCLDGLQDRMRQMEATRLKAEARVAEAEARERLARQARRLARMLAVAGVVVAAMLAAGLSWYANDRLSREADDTRRRTVVLQQIDLALTEAETLDRQAQTDTETWPAREAAARQALAARRRAETLLFTIPNPPDELRDRFNSLNTRFGDTELATRLATALERWQASVFTAGGWFDPGATDSCRDLFAKHGLDVLNCDPLNLAAELKTRLAASIIRDALVEWLAVTADALVRKHLGAVLREVSNPQQSSWLAALESNRPEGLAKLADSPADPPIPAAVYAIVARRLADAGRAGDAKRLLLRGVRRFPSDFPINAQLGILLRSEPGRRADSVRYLTAARTARPDDPIVNFQLGSELADAGWAEEAADLLRSAVKADPKLGAARIRLGELQAADGNVDQSRTTFAAAVAMDPSDAVAQIGLGQAELSRGDTDAAEKAFLAANASGPHAAAAAGLGRIYLRRWQATRAAAAYRTAVELEPNNADYRLGLIESLRKASDSASAIREARAAVKAVAWSAAVHRVFAELLRSSGDKRAAVDAYRAAVRCDPDDVETYLRLGALCESLADPAGAREAYRAAASLKPQDEAIRAAVARVTAGVKELPTTIEACRQVLKRQPANVVVRHHLGRLLAARGDASAIDELRMAADTEQATDQMRLDLADALLRFGRFRQAASAYREAAGRIPETSPKHSAAQSMARKALLWAGLETRLPDALSGALTPSTPTAWADFGEVCGRTGRFASAARFFAKAADGDARYARPAAIYTALAGFGVGSDGKDLTAEKRADLRKSALTSLQRNRNWAADPALAVIKEPPAMSTLSPQEKSDWQSLWAGEQAGR